MPNSPNIVTIAGAFAANTALNSIIYFLLLILFSTVTKVVIILRSKVQGTFKY